MLALTLIIACAAWVYHDGAEKQPLLALYACVLYLS